jgi:hypothetical protein
MVDYFSQSAQKFNRKFGERRTFPVHKRSERTASFRIWGTQSIAAHCHLADVNHNQTSHGKQNFQKALRRPEFSGRSLPPIGGSMKTLALLMIYGSIAGICAAQSVSPRQNEPFAISITPLKAEVKTGVEFFIKIRLTNTTHQDMAERGIFIDEGVDTSYRYDCRDASGKSVLRQLKGVGSVGEIPVLKAGESREEEVPVSRVCDFSRPGRYELQVSRSEPADTEHRVVKSNKITLTVTR